METQPRPSMRDDLAQQDYTREAKRLWVVGTDPTEILRVTGCYTISNHGTPTGIVRGFSRAF
jgi:hypothetical protein